MAANFFAVAWISSYRDVLAGYSQSAMLMCFGFTFLFSNFGPNTTTFVIPVEIYPTLVRATCHGLSAAAGKVGAVVGAVAFSPLEKSLGIGTVLACCGVVTLVGAAFTYFFTSDKVIDLAELDQIHKVHAKPCEHD